MHTSVHPLSMYFVFAFIIGSAASAARPSDPSTQEVADLVAEYKKAKGADHRAFVKRFQELAKKNPKTGIAAEACAWIISNDGQNEPAQQAFAIIGRDHVDSPAIAEPCRIMGAFNTEPDIERALKRVIEANKNPLVLAAAWYGLGLHYRRRAMYAGRPATEAALQSSEELNGRAKACFLTIVKDFPEERSHEGSLTYAEDAKKDLADLETYTVGKVAPDLKYTTIDGKTGQLRDFGGKVVLLDFWQTQYMGTRDLVAGKKALAARHPDSALAIINICCDFRQDMLTNFLKREALPGIHCYCDLKSPLRQEWLTQGIPCTYVIDAAGRIRYRNADGNGVIFYQKQNTTALLALVDRLLADGKGSEKATKGK